MALSLVG